MPVTPTVPTPLVDVGVRAPGAGPLVELVPGAPVEARAEGDGFVVGTGGGSPRDWRVAGAALVRVTGREGGAERVRVALPDDVTAGRAAAFTVGCVVGSHAYRVTRRPRPARLTAVDLVPADGPPDGAADGLAAAVARAGVLGAATALARDLAATPSGTKDPAWLAGTGAQVAGAVRGLSPVVRDQAWLARHGFGGVLAVGRGSARPPRLLELAWRPADAVAGQHLVLVGKGITFDSGGISVKPAEGMHLMRTDMSGGAAVIAAMTAIGRLGLPVRVTGLVPCAENLLSGSAYRPGDVVTHVGGTTTEVTNTDAEGRLVLADALAAAVRDLAPTALVDVATLTGAMKVSLGLRTGGLFATDDGLAGRVLAAGEAAGEAWWRIPLLADLVPDVRSDLADLRQAPPGPGAVTAALFLREFTGGLPWAHLDIAGPARAEKPYDEVGAGGTGFAARTLVELAAGFAGS